MFRRGLSDYSAFSTAALDGLVNDDLSAVVDKAALDKLMKLGSGKNASDWVFGAVYDKAIRILQLLQQQTSRQLAATSM